MFLNAFKSDIIRCFHIKKIFFILLLFVAVLLGGQIQDIQTSLLYFDYGETKGVLEILGKALTFDKFKIVLVMLLAALHTNSFCKDDNTHYLRMILNRTNVVCYTQARFLTNTVFITLLSVLGFVLSAVILSPFFPIHSLVEKYDFYYDNLAANFPVLYLLLMGFQFGILVAAFSSIGLVFSSFQPNAFVSIGLTGLIFFISVSYIPASSIFDIYPVMVLDASFIKWTDGAKGINLSWNILYPTLVIVICGYIFYRRLDWRVKNGDI